MTVTINNICRSVFIVCNVFIITLLTSSCTKDDSLKQEDGDYITFNIETPHYNPLSYSMDVNAESTVRSIDVLAFRVDENDGKEYFKYRSEATSIAEKVGDINTKQFTIQVKKDESKYRFVVLANVKAELDKMAISTTGVKDQVLARLLSKNTEQWDATSSSVFAPIPMWGETATTIQITDDVKNITGIKMIRALAAIDVLVDPVIQTKFQLKEVYLYNRKTRGRVVPIAANYNATTGKVTKPSLPVDSDPSDPLTIMNGLQYTTKNTVKFEKSIYTYETVALESGADLKATCIVVGGSYNGQTDMTYYRIDFKELESDGITFKRYLNLLRNHRYIVKIKSVTAIGYPTPDEAFLQKKGGLSADVQEWNMADMADVVVEGNYSLSVVGSLDIVSPNTYYGYLSIKTDYPTGWSVSTPDSWIQITNTKDKSIDFTLNPLPVGVNERKGEISVKVGNVTKKVAITQRRN